MTTSLPFKAALFDVDGTLIDSNEAHARSWAEALTENGVPVLDRDVRAFIGMGGDKLLDAVAAIDEESNLGKAVAARKKALFAKMLPTLSPTRGARALLEYLQQQDVRLVVATSAGDQEMTALLRQAAVDDLFPAGASKDDASNSKPDPDILRAALQKAGVPASDAIMIGDTPYDIEAGQRAGVRVIALRCGGAWSDRDLTGASLIVADPAALLSHYLSDRSLAGR